MALLRTVSQRRAGIRLFYGYAVPALGGKTRKTENDRAEYERKQGSIGKSGQEPDTDSKLKANDSAKMDKLKQIESDFGAKDNSETRTDVSTKK